MKNESHNGECSFCKTQVPLDASVCTGCGAYWGFSNGRNRIEQVRAFLPKYRGGQILTLGSILGMLYAYFEASKNDQLGWWLISIFIFFTGMSYMLNAWQQIYIGKKGELSWWRRH